MSNKKTFQLIYQVEAEELEEVVLIGWEMFGVTALDPQSITLPDGRVLPWNPFLADKFAAEGHISEAEFIELSLTPNTVVK